MSTPGYPSPSPSTGPGTDIDAGARPKPPSTVTGAFLIYLLVALIAAIGVVLVLTSGVWDEALKNAGSSSIDVDSLVTTAKVVAAVIGVIFLALYLLFDFKMRAGRNWARIVLTVLSVLSIFNAFSASASVTINNQVYQSSSSKALGWVTVVLSLVAIVLMYLPASNRYFSMSKASAARR